MRLVVPLTACIVLAALGCGGGNDASGRAETGPAQVELSDNGSTSGTWVGVAIWNISNFGGQPVSVRVNSFELDAAALSC